jgi:hypothetical protein
MSITLPPLPYALAAFFGHLISWEFANENLVRQQLVA